MVTMALLALVLAGAAEYALLTPMRNANAATAAKLAQMQQKNIGLRQWDGRLRMLRAQNAAAERQWESVEALLPASQAPDEFLHQLQQVANASDVSIRKVTGDPVASKALYQEAPYTLQIDGSFSGVLNFFDRVRALPRLVSVKHWTLKALRGAGGIPTDYAYRSDETVTATCEVSTYFSAAPNAVPPPAKTTAKPAAAHGDAP